MGLLEDALRVTFKAQAVNEPAVDDAAGRAIRAATRIRRRRTTVTLAAAAACVVLIGIGTVPFRPGNGSSPVVGDRPDTTTAPVPARLATAVLVGQRLVLADRTVVDLRLPPVRRAWSLPNDQWVLETRRAETGTAALWLLAGPHPSADPVLLVEGERVAISADGQRVAWGRDGHASVARLAAGALTDRVDTAGTGILAPISFVGDGVLLGGSTTGGTLDRYDMWFPHAGAYVPGKTSSNRMVTPSADGLHLYAFTDTYAVCLIQVKPQGLQMEEAACDLGLDGTEEAYPSPDGQWIAFVRPDRIELYATATIWGSPPPTQVWFGTAQGLAWLDGRSFVVTVDGDLLRYAVDRPGSLAQASIGGPNLVGAGGAQPVPQLG